MISKFITKMKSREDFDNLFNQMGQEDINQLTELALELQKKHIQYAIIPTRYLVILLSLGYMFKDFAQKEQLNELLKK